MDRRRRFDRRQSVEQADVGQLPDVAHPWRRQACEFDLHLFAAWYFPESTGLSPFSADHCQVIDNLQNCLLHGGRFLNVVYRGFAKTTLSEVAALWAALYGHRKYLAIFGAEESLAIQLVSSITKELEENDRLAEDFPEVCVPFRHLDGKNQRAKSQTHQGEHTHIHMANAILVFPTIWIDRDAGIATPSSGTIIRARGLLQGMRGMKYKRADGSNARPDFALIDDPQTDESAASLLQVQKRLNVILKAILKSAGHTKSIACVVNATPICFDDVVEQLSDRERHNSWQTVRIPMVKKWSEAHETLWQEYATLRRGFNPDLPGDRDRAVRAATMFYAEHRPAMDAGCIVSWKYCFDPEVEISAIQHAYNFWFDDPPEVFDSECQCKPASEHPAAVEKLDALTICRRLNGWKRREVPASSTVLTGFIDVHDDVLYWVVIAWNQQFQGSVVDYGTFPDQGKAYFSKRQATRTLKRKFQGKSLSAARILGLEAVIEDLCGKEWNRTDGSICRLDKLGIDTGWEPGDVELVARRSKYAASIQLTRGKGFRANDLQLRDYKRKPGWRFGEEWFIPGNQKRSSRTLWLNTNHWKTFIHARLAAPDNGPDALTLFGTHGDRSQDHRLFADHLLSEHPEEVTAKGLTVIEWAPPNGRDNHWFDGVVGCAALASLLGCSLNRVQEVQRPTRRQRALAAAKKRGLC